MPEKGRENEHNRRIQKSRPDRAGSSPGGPGKRKAHRGNEAVHLQKRAELPAGGAGPEPGRICLCPDGAGREYLQVLH